jgi:hypothetical protein
MIQNIFEHNSSELKLNQSSDKTLFGYINLANHILSLNP